MKQLVKRYCIKETLFILLLNLLCSVELGAQIREGAWYRGDLHTHSIYSDGDSTVAEVIANAESLGFDFFALTDHDTSMNGIPIHWFE